jgi:ankyrin repeat protein
MLLKDARVDPSVDHNKAIVMASKNGHREVVEVLLKDNRVDPTDNNNYAIRFASWNGYKEIIEMFLKDVRVDPLYALQFASGKGHKEIVEILLKHPRMKPSDRYQDAIEIATRNGYTEITQMLEAWAQKNEHKKVIEIIVEEGDHNIYLP